MTVQMNIAQAKARLSELVARAEAGEDVIIARGGKPVVSLIPRTAPKAAGPRPLGFWSQGAPLADPDLFLRPDPDLETLMDAPLDPGP
jgi:prevent-host-death family protein